MLVLGPGFLNPHSEGASYPTIFGFTLRRVFIYCQPQSFFLAPEPVQVPVPPLTATGLESNTSLLGLQPSAPLAAICGRGLVWLESQIEDC